MRLTLLTLLATLCLIVNAQEARVMTLQECVDLAIKNNLNIQRSRLSLETAEANLRQAEYARYPDLNTGAGYQVNFGRSVDPTSNQFVNDQINSFGLSGSSNATLFNWYNLQNNVKQSETEVEASNYDVERSSNNVQLDVVTFYLNVIFNQELLENANYQLQSSKEQLERTKKLVAASSLPISRELELVSQVSSNEVNVINAENNLNQAKLALKQVMLVPASDRIQVSVPEGEVEEADLTIGVDEVFLSAEQNMPEIKAADIRVSGAEYGYQAARSNLYPTVSFSAGARSNFSSAAKPFDPEDPASQWTFTEQIADNLSQFVSLNLSIPIFNGYSARLGTQRSLVNVKQAELNALEQRNFLRQTIETAYNDVQAASKSFAAATKQVEALEETFRTVERQFQLNAANSTDYQVASNNLFQAKSDLTRAKFDFIFKKKLLDFYQGKPIF